jgi:predicted methyltransferase
MKQILLMSAASALALSACTEQASEVEAEDAAAVEPATTETEAVETVAEVEGDPLAEVLADERRADDMARDVFRNPAETVAFFEIEPSHSVVEALPGGGWYGRILAPYVSEEGAYYGINYPMTVYEELFGDRLTDERRASLAAWDENFAGQVEGWGGVSSGAYRFTELAEGAGGDADRVLFIRALHNLNRAGRMEAAIGDAMTLLKPGGLVGVVQHRAPADEADDRGDGSRGYMRQADIVAAFEAGGFELVEASEINANPNDAADYDDGVWMLPPTNGGDSEGEDIPPLQSVGESDRMTLKFRKPE